MIVTIYGDNSYSINQSLRRLEADFTRQYGGDGIQKLTAADLESDNLEEFLTAGSLFSKARLLVIEDLSKNKPLAERFIDIASGVSDDVTVVLVERDMDKRTKLYRFLSTNSKLIECGTPDEDNLVKWLQEEAGNSGANLDREVARKLVERVGNDQWRLISELNKLVDFDSTITEETVDKVVEKTPQESIFELLDATVNGNSRDSIKLYKELRQANADPYYVLSMVAWQLHNMLLIKAAGKRPARTIVSQAGLSPFVVSKTASVVSSIGINQVKDMIEAAAKADMRLKSTSSSPDAVLEYLLMRISQIARE